jgi:hypothetical protein
MKACLMGIWESRLLVPLVIIAVGTLQYKTLAA